MSPNLLDKAKKAFSPNSTDSTRRQTISSPTKPTMANRSLSISDSSKKPSVVCVFCASGPGKNPVHMESARTLAAEFHAHNISLVYGGGTVGIMGELAQTLVGLSGPGAVHGVIPRALIRTEKGYDGTDIGKAGQGKEAEKTVTAEELRKVDSGANGSLLKESEFGHTTIVPDMHTRKRLMAQKVIEGGPGSGFVALAGGYGTIEEVMEMVTWNQLGIHKMPIVLVNIGGYWDGLLSWVRNSVKEGYVSEGNADILVEVKGTGEVVEALRRYRVSEERYKLDWST